MPEKPIRWVAVGDNHGNLIEQSVADAFFDFLGFWKPKLRLHLGDGFNFACLRKGASEEEKREEIEDDVNAGVDFIDRFKPTHYLRGNHCERVFDCAKSDDGKLRAFASGVIDEMVDALGDAVILPYDKRAGLLRIGKLKAIHGYSSGIQATRLAAQIYGSVLMAHLHVIDAQSIPGIERRIGRCIGCLCALDQQYNRAHANTLKQAHGWAYGLLLPSGDYVYWQAERVAGKWHLPSEMKVFG